MRPMWVTETSIRREQNGDKPPVFLVRMENNAACVEVKMSARKFAAFVEEGVTLLPAETVSAR